MSARPEGSDTRKTKPDSGVSELDNPFRDSTYKPPTGDLWSSDNPPGSSMDAPNTTPAKNIAWKEEFDDEAKERVATACGDCCAISWESGCHVQFCHVVPKAWAWQNFRGRSIFFIDILEFACGCEQGTLNLHTSSNVLQLQADWHCLFDRGGFILMPKEEAIWTAVIKFFGQNFMAMSQWSQKSSRVDYHDFYKQANLNNTPLKFEYRVVPLHKWPSGRVIHRMKGNGQANEDDSSDVREYYRYPLPHFINPQEEPPECVITSHIHPLFAAIHASRQFYEVLTPTEQALGLDPGLEDQEAIMIYLAAAEFFFREETLTDTMEEVLAAFAGRKITPTSVPAASPSASAATRRSERLRSQGKQSTVTARDISQASDSLPANAPPRRIAASDSGIRNLSGPSQTTRPTVARSHTTASQSGVRATGSVKGSIKNSMRGKSSRVIGSAASDSGIANLSGPSQTTRPKVSIKDSMKGRSHRPIAPFQAQTSLGTAAQVFGAQGRTNLDDVSENRAESSPTQSGRTNKKRKTRA